MKIFAYTENYASETATFITNELARVDAEHELLLAYSTRKNPDRYNLKNMVCIPYTENKFICKLKWWAEQSQLYFSLYNPSFSKVLNKTISEFKPDIIHCHFGTSFLKLIINLSSENSKIPILISFYGFEITERIQNKAVLHQYKKYLSLPNVKSIAVSESLVQNINNYIQPFNKANVIHSGIDTDFFRRKEIKLNKDEFVFLQVSFFNEKKGHKYTLQAFKQFISENKAYNYKFIIVGLGFLEKDIKQQIIDLELSNYVTMLGPVTPSEMVELSSRVNCFVHMSVTANNGDQEGLPNVILEAMSLELPILSTKHAGIPEIVIDGEHGILCEEKNIPEYVSAFHKILEWKPLPNSRERIINHFSLNTHMTHLTNLYITLAN